MNKRRKRRSEEILPPELATPKTRIAHLQYRNVRRREANEPLTGAYYWIPIPREKGVQWDLMEFFDKDYPDEFAGHPHVWPEVVNYLAMLWRRPVQLLVLRLDNSLYGLPRGRVAQMPDGRYGIAHGNDVPLPAWENVIKQAFNLTNVPVYIYQDEHERMLPGHPQDVQNALGIESDLGLKTVDLEEDE